MCYSFSPEGHASIPAPAELQDQRPTKSHSRHYRTATSCYLQVNTAGLKYLVDYIHSWEYQKRPVMLTSRWYVIHMITYWMKMLVLKVKNIIVETRASGMWSAAFAIIYLSFSDLLCLKSALDWQPQHGGARRSLCSTLCQFNHGGSSAGSAEATKSTARSAQPNQVRLSDLWSHFDLPIQVEGSWQGWKSKMPMHWQYVAMSCALLM